MIEQAEASDDGQYEHIVLTRFWFRLAANGRDSGPTPDPQWLEGRLELFKRYCLPSVVAQSVQNFRWFVYFDANTPGAFIQKLRDVVSPYRNVEVRTLATYESESLASDIRSCLAPYTKRLLTTRLDTDDGWHCDFVKRLQTAIDGTTREFLNFPVGILAYDGRIYLYRHMSNAFISLWEPVDGAKTVYCGPHEQLSRVAPIRQLEPWPAFMQIVHGTNLSNKPRGMRVHKLLALNGFEEIKALFTPPIDESDASILTENITTGLAWRVRDAVLRVGKRAVLLMKSG